MLGGHRATFSRALRVGETYRATAEIINHEEKKGTEGPFTIVTMAYTVETIADEPAFKVETDFVEKPA